MKRADHYHEIAEQVTREIATGGAQILYSQVVAVANGTDKTENHPVINAIRNELKRRKLI